MARLGLVLFGGFRASIGDRPVELPLKKARALLAFLALAPGVAHSREQLATLLWGDRPDDQARNSLRQTLFALRTPLGSGMLLQVDGADVRLDPRNVEVDAITFERLVADGTDEALARAVTLYQGDLLDGVAVEASGFEGWLEATRERFRRSATGAMTRLLDRQVRAGATATAIETARRLLRFDPLQEPVHRTLIELYVREGRRTEAVRQYHACADLLRRELRAEPEVATVRAYRRLLGERAARPTDAATPWAARMAANSPFVGRAAELARLREHLAHAAAGQGGVVALLGEPGIGKTRLTEEFLAGAATGDLLVVRGRAYESARVLPFALWVDTLAKEAPDRVPELRDLGHGWARDLEPLFLDGRRAHGRHARAGDRLRVFDALTQFVGWLAAARTLVIVLEDLHWADDMSLRVLAYAGRRLAAWPVLTIGTARPEEAEATRLTATLAELERETRLARVTLRPLSAHDTAALTRGLARPGLPAARLAAVIERVQTVSEGNPFVVTEMIRALPREGLAGVEEDLGLPETVREMILNRVRRLSPPTQRLLALATVIGRDFDVRLLQAAAGLGELEVAEGVEQLLRAGVFRESAERLDVAHDRIRDALAHDLRGPRRRALHAAVARALETRGEGALAQDSADLARHYQAAGVWDRAVRYLRMAGGQAAARGAYREAVGFFEQALAALARLPAGPETLAQAFDVRIELRDWLMPLGDLRGLGAHLEEAEAAARRLADDHRIGFVVGHLAHYHWQRGDNERALAAAWQAAEVAERLREPTLQILSNFYLGEVYHALGDYRASVERLRRNVAQVTGDGVFERYGGPGLVPLQSRFWLAFSLAELGEFAEAMAIAAEAHRAAQTVQHPFSFAFAEYALGRLQVAQRAVGPGITALERARALMESREIVLMLPACDAWLGYARAMAGSAADGVPLLERAFDAVAVQGRSGGGLAAALLAESLVMAGRAGDAIPWAGRALEMTRRHGERGHETIALRALGDAHAGRDETSAAEARYRDALVLAEALGMRAAAARCHLALGRLHRRLGRLAASDEALARAAGLFADLGLPAWLDEVRALGLDVPAPCPERQPGGQATMPVRQATGGA